MVDAYSAFDLYDIDLDSPLNPYSRLNKGLELWLKSLPGRMGGSRWWDLLKRNPGTLTNMASGSGWGGSPAPGGFGSLRFDAVDDYVIGATNSQFAFSSAGAEFTVAATVKLPQPAIGVAYQICSNGGKSDTSSGWFLYAFGYGGDGNRYWQMKIGNGSSADACSVLKSDTNWHRVVGVISASTVSLYVDGLLGSSGARTVTISSVSQFNIGRSGSTAIDFLSGSIDDVKIYSRALTAAEVQAEYTDARLGNPSTLNRIGGMTAAQQAILFRRALNARIGSRSPHVGFGGL